MRFQEIIEAKNTNPGTTYKLWTAPVRIKQHNYIGYIDVTVTAATQQDARRLMRAQYGVQDWNIGATTEVK
jgi:hypothetical protein